MGREEGASVVLNATKTDSIISVETTLSGSDSSTGYIMLMMDNNPINIYETRGNGTFDFSIPDDGNEHIFKAYFSGTTSTAAAQSLEAGVDGANLKSIVLSDMIKVSSGKGFIEISSPNEMLLPLYDLTGKLIKAVKISENKTKVYVSAGVYVIGGKKVVVS